MACVSEIRTYSPLPRHVNQIADAPQSYPNMLDHEEWPYYGGCNLVYGLGGGGRL